MIFRTSVGVIRSTSISILSLLFQTIKNSFYTLLLLLGTITLVSLCHHLRLNCKLRSGRCNPFFALVSTSLSSKFGILLIVNGSCLAIGRTSTIGHFSHSGRLSVWIINGWFSVGKLLFGVRVSKMRWILSKDIICFSVDNFAFTLIFLTSIASSALHTHRPFWFSIIRWAFSKFGIVFITAIPFSSHHFL